MLKVNDFIWFSVNDVQERILGIVTEVNDEEGIIIVDFMSFSKMERAKINIELKSSDGYHYEKEENLNEVELYLESAKNKNMTLLKSIFDRINIINSWLNKI